MQRLGVTRGTLHVRRQCGDLRRTLALTLPLRRSKMTDAMAVCVRGAAPESKERERDERERDSTEREREGERERERLPYGLTACTAVR